MRGKKGEEELERREDRHVERVGVGLVDKSAGGGGDRRVRGVDERAVRAAQQAVGLDAQEVAQFRRVQLPHRERVHAAAPGAQQSQQLLLNLERAGHIQRAYSRAALLQIQTKVESQLRD